MSGQRAFLFSSTIVTTTYPYPQLAFPTQGTMKVYAVAGEKIYLGSSAQGKGAGRMNVRAPDGSTYSSGSSTTIGLISNRTQEMAGPSPNTSGYTPYIITVGTGQTGVWEIDFVSPDASLSGLVNYPAAVNTSASWTQGSTTAYVTAFDVSVRNTTNTAFLTGRVFTNIFSASMGAANAQFYGTFQVVTKDGYIYDVNNNGQAGWAFSFFANNKGFRNSSGNASYKSVNSSANPPVQDPRASDSGTDITHKIFFNTPSSDLPTTANTPTGTTWLLNTPISPVVTNFTLNGIEGSSGLVGANPLGGYIGFNANQAGAYIINIDVNQNGAFNDGVDRKLTGSATSGANQVYWDGMDGQNSKITGATTLTASSIKVTLVGGEVHFPFLDVENNNNGIVITRTNGIGAGDNIVYFDDSNITGGGLNLDGGNSLTAGHKWGTTAYSLTAFGDDKGLDTWAYVLSTALSPASSFQFKEADLQIVEIAKSATVFCYNNPGSFTVKIKNSGPSSVSGATFRFTFPSELTGLAMPSLTLISGSTNVSSGTLSSNQYDAVLDMDNGAEISFTFTGSVTARPTGNEITVTASIMRPADVADPDATDPDTAVPTNPLTECNASPSGTGCNNILEQTTQVPVVATPIVMVN